MGNVWWRNHNKRKQVDLRHVVSSTPIFSGVRSRTSVLSLGQSRPLAWSSSPSPGLRPALPRPSPIQSQPSAGPSGPSPGLRPPDWRPVSVFSGTACGLGNEYMYTITENQFDLKDDESMRKAHHRPAAEMHRTKSKNITTVWRPTTSTTSQCLSGTSTTRESRKGTRCRSRGSTVEAADHLEAVPRTWRLKEERARNRRTSQAKGVEAMKVGKRGVTNAKGARGEQG